VRLALGEQRYGARLTLDVWSEAERRGSLVLAGPGSGVEVKPRMRAVLPAGTA
jgi:hypothetical protein